MFERLRHSKTFWAALVTIVGTVGAMFLGDVPLMDGLKIVFDGILAIFIRDGVAKVAKGG